MERAVVALCAGRYGSQPTTRAQLLTLPKYVDPDLARDTTTLWCSLSRAAHHHDYELIPTADELRSWHTDAVRITRDLLDALKVT